MTALANLLGMDTPVQVVDVGANPIDSTPPYAPLLSAGLARVVGFEPQADALARLQEKKGPHETYLPCVVGDGKSVRFRICRAPGMSSTLKPNLNLLKLFHGFPDWAQVVEEREVTTVRLDDVAEVTDIDFLKMDTQGGEMAVLDGAARKAAEAIVIQTEVNFLPMYEGQALFAEIDLRLRGMGFALHALDPIHRRAIAPVLVNGSIYEGLRQVFWTDAIYVKDPTRLDALSSVKLRKLVLVLHEAYRSFDLAQHAIKVHDDTWGSALWPVYMRAMGLDSIVPSPESPADGLQRRSPA